MLWHMTLLYLALAYLTGIAVGRLAWDIGWLDCTWPGWLWWMPIALLPALPLLNRLAWFQPQPIPLRWPTQAGFAMPRQGASPLFWIALGLCLLTGTLRYASQPLEPCWATTDLAYYNLPSDQAFEQSAPLTTLVGYVSSYPLVADTKQKVQVAVNQATVDGVERTVQGEVLLNTNIRQRYAYGQPLRLVGRLVTPPVFEDFSYREYLARKRIHSLLYGARIDMLPEPNRGNWLTGALFAFRARGETLLNRLLPEPYAALANGMLLGIEAGIPDDLYEKFNLTGTSHTIVISGSNVAIISSMFMLLGQRLLGRRRAVWPTLVGIGCYALLVGGDAAVLRAALMGSLFVVATALGRRSTALVSLAVACWAMTLVNPLTLWDVGFQLSSAATAGLILFATGITQQFSKLWPGFSGGPLTASAGLTNKTMNLLQGLIQDGLLVTIAANITTLPLVLYYFGRLSVVSLLTNLLISPVQSLIMLGGTVGILVGVVGLSWLAWLILLVPWLSLVWTVSMVGWTAALPGASLEIGGYNFGSLLVTYLLIASLYWRSSLWERFQHGWRWIVGNGLIRVVGPGTAAVLSIGCILLWTGARSQPDGRLHVYFLDIGQGDGILIQTPSGRQVLLDGGGSPQGLFSELGAVMPFWDRSLDVVAMTNPDQDHMGAQTQASTRLQISTALETSAAHASQDAEGWRANMAAGGATVQIQQTGHWFDLGDGVALWVLWPPAEIFSVGSVKDEQFVDNENSLVMKLVYGEFSVLLTGDAGLPAEMALLAAHAPVQATVLKVGHHGSKGSSSHSFVEAVNPAIAVIQSGSDNSYGHPHQDTLDRLAGRLVLRNDLHGRVHLYSDGRQIWLETETNLPKVKP